MLILEVYWKKRGILLGASIMRLPIFFVVGAAFCVPVCAAPRSPKAKVAPKTKAPSKRPLSFDEQRAASGATRIDTLDELRDGKSALSGKVVEVRGQIKGLFGGGGGQTLLLQLPDGQSQTISASSQSGFAASPCAHVGNWMRALCRVEGSAGNEVSLDLLRVTDQPEHALFSGAGDDTSPMVAPRSVPGAPPPAEVLLAPDADLSVTPSSSLSPSGTLAPSGTVENVPDSQGQTPASQSNPSPAKTNRRAPRANALFGFDDVSRAGFKSLAQRFNPRLSDESADAISVSLLEAAQSQSLDPRFLAAVVQVESRFDPYAVSSAGALGLGQLMPFNCRTLGVRDGFDVRQNLYGSARLLRQNLNIYSRDRNGTMLAVAAYHAGVGAVNRAGRAIPKATTERYVWKVYYAYRAMAPELFR